jgi:pseudoazurin
MAGASLLVRPTAARAAVHEIAMLNQHPDDRSKRMIYLPRLLKVQPGDSVTFLATDRGHNSATIDGMVPDGGTAWNGAINEEVTVTLETPGFYGYKCTPHYMLGMVGLIVVEGDGKLANLEAARSVSHRGRAQMAFDEIWSTAEQEGLLA